MFAMVVAVIMLALFVSLILIAKIMSVAMGMVDVSLAAGMMQVVLNHARLIQHVLMIVHMMRTVFLINATRVMLSVLAIALKMRHVWIHAVTIVV